MLNVNELQHPKSMPWKISRRMLEEIHKRDGKLYCEIHSATKGNVYFVTDDTLFAKTDAPEDGGLPYERDPAYEALQVWRQRKGKLKSTLKYDNPDPETWGRPES